MSRERTPAGNILALGRSREEQAKAVQETATSYMPTNIDLGAWLPEEDQESEGDGEKLGSPSAIGKARGDKVVRKPATTAKSDATRKKRISLYLDDDILTKVFRVSLEQHEQLSTATHRLILEALKARGM